MFSRREDSSLKMTPGSDFTEHIFTEKHSGVDSTEVLRRCLDQIKGYYS